MATNELGSEISKTETTPGQNPVNLRFRIPFFPLFVTLIVGREKRSHERLREERIRHPLNIPGNIICGFFAGLMVAILLLLLALYTVFPLPL